MNMQKIIIIEDHPIVRKGFIMLINQEEDMMIVGEAEDPENAIRLIKKIEADIALVDLSLNSGNGIELIKEIKNIKPDLPVLVVSLHDENIYAERVLKAGARGYVMKSEATENILSAIRMVSNGEIFLSAAMKSRLINKMAGVKLQVSMPMDILSDRELEVFQLIGEGKTTKEIADTLNLSIKTIETYKSHIKNKLDIRDSTELIQFAVEWKVLDS